MTDSQKEELRGKLKEIAEGAEASGLVAKFYSPEVLVVCLPADEEAPQETGPQRDAQKGSPRGEGGKGSCQGTLL